MSGGIITQLLNLTEAKQMMNEVEDLIKKIGIKHDVYCTFTIRSGSNKNGGKDYSNVNYQTYISVAADPRHRIHYNVKEAIERLSDFEKKDKDDSMRIKEQLEVLENRIDSDTDSVNRLKYDLHLIEKAKK